MSSCLVLEANVGSVATCRWYFFRARHPCPAEGRREGERRVVVRPEERGRDGLLLEVGVVALRRNVAGGISVGVGGGQDNPVVLGGLVRIGERRGLRSDRVRGNSGERVVDDGREGRILRDDHPVGLLVGDRIPNEERLGGLGNGRILEPLREEIVVSPDVLRAAARSAGVAVCEAAERERRTGAVIELREVAPDRGAEVDSAAPGANLDAVGLSDNEVAAVGRRSRARGEGFRGRRLSKRSPVCARGVREPPCGPFVSEVTVVGAGIVRPDVHLIARGAGNGIPGDDRQLRLVARSTEIEVGAGVARIAHAQILDPELVQERVVGECLDE